MKEFEDKTIPQIDGTEPQAEASSFERAILMCDMVMQTPSSSVIDYPPGYAMPRFDIFAIPLAYKAHFLESESYPGKERNRMMSDREYMQRLAGRLTRLAPDYFSPFTSIADILRNENAGNNAQNKHAARPLAYREATTRKQRAAFWLQQMGPNELDSLNRLQTSDFEMARELAGGLKSVLAYAERAPLHDVALKDADSDVMQLSDAARRQMLKSFLYLKSRGLSSDEVIYTFSYMVNDCYLDNFLREFQSDSLRNFTGGVFAELYVSLHYQDRGFTIDLGDAEADALGQDLMVSREDETRLVQVKGSYDLTGITEWDLSNPADKQQLLEWINKKKKSNSMVKTVDALQYRARGLGAKAVWCRAPSSVTKVLPDLDKLRTPGGLLVRTPRLF